MRLFRRVRGWASVPRSDRGGKVKPAFRLWLQALEDRIALNTYFWTGKTSSDWGLPANWWGQTTGKQALRSPGDVTQGSSAVNDVVHLDPDQPGFNDKNKNVVVSSNRTIAALNLDRRYDGELTLNANLTDTGYFRMWNGTIDGTKDLIIGAKLGQTSGEWDGGTMTGSGKTILMASVGQGGNGIWFGSLKTPNFVIKTDDPTLMRILENDGSVYLVGTLHVKGNGLFQNNNTFCLGSTPASFDYNGLTDKFENAGLFCVADAKAGVTLPFYNTPNDKVHYQDSFTDSEYKGSTVLYTSSLAANRQRIV